MMRCPSFFVSAVVLSAASTLAACNDRSDDGPVVVSAIGGAPALIDPARG